MLDAVAYAVKIGNGLQHSLTRAAQFNSMDKRPVTVNSYNGYKTPSSLPDPIKGSKSAASSRAKQRQSRPRHSRLLKVLRRPWRRTTRRPKYKVPVVVRQLQDCPRGYPSLAAFLDSDENFMIYRRFGYLQSRLLLDKQAELRKLELELNTMDEQDEQNKPRRLITHDPNEQDAEARRVLFRALEQTYCDYANTVAAARSLLAFTRPSSSDYQSIAKFMQNKELVEEEREWISRKEDMTTPRKNFQHPQYPPNSKILKEVEVAYSLRLILPRREPRSRGFPHEPWSIRQTYVDGSLWGKVAVYEHQQRDVNGYSEEVEVSNLILSDNIRRMYKRLHKEEPINDAWNQLDLIDDTEGNKIVIDLGVLMDSLSSLPSFSTRRTCNYRSSRVSLSSLQRKLLSGTTLCLLACPIALAQGGLDRLASIAQPISGGLSALSGFSLVAFHYDPQVGETAYYSVYGVWAGSVVTFISVLAYLIGPGKRGKYILTCVIVNAVLVAMFSLSTLSARAPMTVYAPLLSVATAFGIYQLFLESSWNRVPTQVTSDNAERGIHLPERSASASRGLADGQAATRDV